MLGDEEFGVMPNDIKAVIEADKAATVALSFGYTDEHWANLFLQALWTRGYKVISKVEYRELMENA